MMLKGLSHFVFGVLLSIDLLAVDCVLIGVFFLPSIEVDCDSFFYILIYQSRFLKHGTFLEVMASMSPTIDLNIDGCLINFIFLLFSLSSLPIASQLNNDESIAAFISRINIFYFLICSLTPLTKF